MERKQLDAASLVPQWTAPSGTVKWYVDATNGDDSYAGDSFAAGHPWKTIAKAQAAQDELLCFGPTALTVEVFFRGSFSETMAVPAVLPGNTRIFWGQHVDDLTSYRTGNVAVGTLDGETPAPQHGCSGMELETGTPLDGTEVGMSLVLTDPEGDSRTTVTIIRVDVATQYVWVSMPRGGLPAWVSASPADCKVAYPSFYVDRSVGWSPSGARIGAPASGPSATYSWLINCRMASSLTLGGDWSACCGCYVKSAGGTWGILRYSAPNAFLGWRRSVVSGVETYMPEDVAEDFGLIAGTTPATNNTVGNAAGTVDMAGGKASSYGLYLDDKISNSGVATLSTMYSNPEWVQMGDGGSFSGLYWMSRGETGYPHMEVACGGDLAFDYWSGVDLPVAGNARVFWARTGGVIESVGAGGHWEVNNTGSGSSCNLFEVDGGEVWIYGGIPDGAKAKHKQIWIGRGGRMRIDDSGITMTAAREGADSDIEVEDGELIIDGNVVKSVVNTAASTHLTVGPLGRVMQRSGSWTLPKDPCLLFALSGKVTGAANGTSGSGAATIAAWVKYTGCNPGTAAALFCFGVWNMDTAWSAYSWDDGVIVAGLCGRETTTGITQDGLWHRLAFTYEGGASKKVQVYADGAWVGESAAVTPNVTAAQPVIIGASSAGLGYPFGGCLDDVREYTRAWTAQEVADDYAGLAVSATNLTRQWKMDEGTGTTTHEEVGDTEDAITVATWADRETWVTSYGSDGAINVDGGKARLGALTGGCASTTGMAASVRKGGTLQHGGAGLGGTAPIVIGGSAAAAWPTAAKTDNAATTPELCLVVPNIT